MDKQELCYHKYFHHSAKLGSPPTSPRIKPKNSSLDQLCLIKELYGKRVGPGSICLSFLHCLLNHLQILSYTRWKSDKARFNLNESQISRMRIVGWKDKKSTYCPAVLCSRNCIITFFLYTSCYRLLSCFHNSSALLQENWNFLLGINQKNDKAIKSFLKFHRLSYKNVLINPRCRNWLLQEIWPSMLQYI